MEQKLEVIKVIEQWGKEVRKTGGKSSTEEIIDYFSAFVVVVVVFQLIALALRIDKFPIVIGKRKEIRQNVCVVRFPPAELYRNIFISTITNVQVKKMTEMIDFTTCFVLYLLKSQ